jgi:hypothetical protein
MAIFSALKGEVFRVKMGRNPGVLKRGFALAR